MQIVSENWRNAHKQSLLNESFVEISLEVSDPEALAHNVPTDNGAIYLSNSSNLTKREDNSPTPYCTLEQNLWVLNGERKAIPESDFVREGYISDTLSDETCIFSEKVPTITIEFGGTFSKLIPGVTITWSNTYGEYATDFLVRAYYFDHIVAEKEVTNNRSIKSLVLVDIAEYNSIVIYVKKWCLPHHRARVEEIFIGMDKVYTKADLFDYSHKQSVSPVSTSLPKNEIQFSIDNVSGEYNPYNEQGLAKYLMSQQEIKTRYGLKLDDNTIEWIKGGTFYLSEWSAKQNGLTAEFTARDLLEFMSAIYYDNHDLSERSLYDMAEDVLLRAKLPSNSMWVIDESLRDIKTTAPLPEDTIANCLQLIANAGRCVIYPDRDGTLHIEPLKADEGGDYSISPFNSYSKAEITLSKPIQQVVVTVYSYTNKDGEIESTTHNVTERVGETGEIITVDNPLVTNDAMASSLAQWLALHLGHRMTLDSSWRVDVRLDALDVVTNENDYRTNRVRMTDVEFKYNGAFRGTGKGKVI